MERPSFLTRMLDVPADRPALWWEPQPGVVAAAWTHGDLRTRGEHVAGWLRDQGVRRGDRVVIHLDNGPALVAAHLGCMALGAVRVPVNRHYRAAEVAPIREDAEPVLVFSEEPALWPGLPVFPAPGHGPRLADWPTPPGDVTGLLFTSGTTGRAKGVPQTFGMWESNLDAVATRWELGPDDRLHLVLPLFHTHGLVLGLHHSLLRGSSARLGARFEPVAPAPDVTHVYGVPTFWHRWEPVIRADPAPFRRLRLVVSGSDGLDPALSDRLAALLGQRPLERYGMTETVMLASNPARGERRAGSVGTALDGVELRVVDDEVQVRGPNVFPGYWRPGPEAPVGALPLVRDAAAGFTADGFFRTGDAGAWDPAPGGEAPYLRLVGRKKDLVIVGGVNVSPAEVERVLAAVPGVADVACCGLPDEDLNEVVAAAVVPDGTVPTALLAPALDAAAHALSGLKRPRAWAFVDALPRNALGKVQSARLRAEVEFRRG